MKVRLRTCFGVLLVVGLAVSLQAETRWHQYHKRYGTPKNPAQVVTASLLDAGGSEWLVGGGFLTDGSIVIVGNTVGPEFSLQGVTPGVLGTDEGKPDYELRPWSGKKAPVVNSKGEQMKAPPGATEAKASGFILILSKDGKKIQNAVRLSWKSGPLFDAKVDSAGNIYLLGMAGEEIASLGKSTQQEKPAPPPAPPEPEGKKKKKKKRSKAPPDTDLFLAKVSADLGKIEWINVFNESPATPELQLVGDKKLIVNSQYYSEYDLEGERTRIMTDWGKGGRRVRGVSPVDGSFVVGGDSNSNTGREPWRKPYLFVMNPEGKVNAHLYQWNSGMIGADTCRLVSDSAIRGAHYTPDGKYVWLVGWSDGGNSVLNQQPFNLFSKVKSDGLGMSMWGANVLSACYLLKMNVETFEVETKTIWGSYLKNSNKPNGISITSLTSTADGSLIGAGGSASGLIQTENHLYAGEDNPEFAPGGAYVTVFSPQLNQLRFSSVLSACGTVSIGKKRFSLARKSFGNNSKVLVLSGAVPESKSKYDVDHQKPPTVNAFQSEFGTGSTDGHFLVLEMENMK